MHAIETRELTKYYGNLCAVDHLSLSVDREIFGLLGPNGSGKTTTVLMLTTLLTPSDGKGMVCGYDVVRDGREIRKKISYVPQDMAVDIKLTGRENVVFFARLYGVPEPEKRAEEVLAVMELSDRADDLVRTYSGGMRCRLELAQALVHNPDVLFLDEPTIGLDVAARKKIWEHIHALKEQGMTIFVTTHYMDEANQFCDRVEIINKGKIVALGTPPDLKARLMRDIVTVKSDGECPDPDLPGITRVNAENGETVFAAENGKAAIPLLADALKSRGITVQEMSLREPTLDDVFLQAVGNQEEPEGFDYDKFRIMLRRRK